MRAAVVFAAVVALLSGRLFAQEPKRVPKDSVRVSIPGCSKGYVFTAGPRTVDEPGSGGVPDGMHLRMNGPKKVMADIKAHEGALIEITGLMRKGQYQPGGINLGGGIRVGPAPNSPASGGGPIDSGGGQTKIDVEGWRQIVGNCPSR